MTFGKALSGLSASFVAFTNMGTGFGGGWEWDGRD